MNIYRGQVPLDELVVNMPVWKRFSKKPGGSAIHVQTVYSRTHAGKKNAGRSRDSGFMYFL
jgi:hypothetical protein